MKHPRVLAALLCAMLLCSALLGTLTGCASEEDAPDPHHGADQKEVSYTIQKIGGQNYLVFDPVPTGTLSCCTSAGISFPSLTEMREWISGGTMSGTRGLTVQKTFDKDENGILMLDLDRLYAPVLPDHAEMQDVTWFGNRYSLSFSDSTAPKASSDDFHFLPNEEELQAEYERNVENTLAVEVDRTHTDDRDADIVSQVTSCAELKEIRYTLQSEGKTIRVVERYVLRSDYATLKVSETVPSSVELYGMDHGACFEVYLSDPEARPTVEYLQSFGMELLSPPQAEAPAAS